MIDLFSGVRASDGGDVRHAAELYNNVSPL